MALEEPQVDVTGYRKIMKWNLRSQGKKSSGEFLSLLVETIPNPQSSLPFKTKEFDKKARAAKGPKRQRLNDGAVQVPQPLEVIKDQHSQPDTSDEKFFDTNNIFQTLKPSKQMTQAQRNALKEGRPIAKKSGYHYFIHLCYEEYNTRFPGEDVYWPEFASICGRRWRAMTLVEKWSFNDMSRRDQIRFDEEMKIYERNQKFTEIEKSSGADNFEGDQGPGRRRSKNTFNDVDVHADH